MKVGDYVRLDRYQGIRKIDDYDEEIKEYFLDGDIYDEWGDLTLKLEKYDVVKFSPNIIDLIEVGDYVNGYLIDYIDSERRYLRSERPYREDSTMYKDLIEKGRNYNQCLHFFEDDIKSIVTREQFEAIKYEIK